MTRTLFHNGVVHGRRPSPRATALAVEGGRIAFVGDEDAAAAYDGAEEVVDLHGALLAPAFVDSHLHLVRTGFALTGLDPGRRAYLTRVDGHSSVVSPALAALVPGLEQLDGWTPDGRVERDAHHAVRATLESLIGPDDRLGAARAAARQLAARGAFGSRTAALSAPYADRPDSCGHGYVTADQVRDHVVACTEAGLQAGFHCIGDAALEEVRDGLEQAERVLGAARIAAARHRLEHVEMPSPAVVATMSRLGVVASVQPMFDGRWGGPDGMYAARLGERWRTTNPLCTLETAPVRLAFGSDSPVTPVHPWATVGAAVHHHHEHQRLPLDVAFRAHTHGGAFAARDDDGGLPDLSPGLEPPRLVRTVSAGRTIHRSEQDAA